MDRLIERFDFKKDDDLHVCEHRGVAYQADMSKKIAYDNDYFENYKGKTQRHPEISESRVKWVEEFGEGSLLDVGIGSGDFILRRNEAMSKECTYGYDINTSAKKWLMKNNFWRDDVGNFRAFSFWDVIEHLETPENYFKLMPDDTYLFTSIPIFEKLSDIRGSKHYKPGEHLYYWTNEGFIDFMGQWGFRLVKGPSDHEVKAGRQGISAYAFKKDLPDYHKTLDQYTQIHSTQHYGDSAGPFSGTDHFHTIAELVKESKATAILDYGCGRSDLAAWFWNDGARQIYRYDPAIPRYKNMTNYGVDLVLCTDVMEHILMRDIDRVLDEIREKSKRAIFTISMKLARRKLPDGRNAHVTILTKSEWMRWIKQKFKYASEVRQPNDKLLIVRTF